MEIRQGSPFHRSQSNAVQKKGGHSLGAEVGSLVVFALGLFLLCSLLTYHPADPSWFSNATGAAQNACGRAGAFLSALLLGTFGVGSFLTPAALFFMSVSIFKREGMIRLVGTLGGMTVAVMSMTVFLSLQWKYWPYAGTLMLTGGTFGVWAATLLETQFNSLGASIISMLVFCLALVLSTPVSIALLGGRILKFLGVVLWRATKASSVFIAYWAGILAMRLAHAIGDAVQRGIERAIERHRERKQEKERARLEAKRINSAVKKALADESHSEDTENQELKVAGAEGVVVASEAPNVLPELEQQKLPLPDLPPAEPVTPEIVPLSAEDATGEGASSGKKKSDGTNRTRMTRATRRGQWKLPTIEFLKRPVKNEGVIDKAQLMKNSELLKQKFADFEIDGDVTAVRPGPVITLYEFKPAPGIKLSKIASLSDDLSMALSAQSVRIIAPLPGKSVVGIEIPSSFRETVFLREFLQQTDFYDNKHAIPIAMGKDIGGQPYLSDLVRMPHLLCAGQTGSGKSVFMNALICSLLYRFTPDELRMILVDPKVIEFQSYQDIPHLLLPIVDDPSKASLALKWAVREMERRYRIMARLGVRNLASFNTKVEEMGADVVQDLLFSEENQPDENTVNTAPGGDWLESFEPDENGTPKVGKLPYIVIIIDELADLMMVAKKDVEVSIARIAQKARAAGLHLVVATQRPSTDVVTGLIKANLPSRLSFQLATNVDSRTILDRAGAEKLLGRGDMLFIPPGVSQILRLHSSFVQDEEIEKITAFLRSQGKPLYREDILAEEEEDGEEGEENERAEDALFEEAVDWARRAGRISASALQRQYMIGYNRAARMVEMMEARGIVGPAEGARPREVLMR